MVHVVPVPFKHGIDNLLTLDDILVDIWMDSMFVTTSSGTCKSMLLLETLACWENDNAKPHQLAIFGIRDAGSDHVTTYTNEPLFWLVHRDASHWECNWPGSFLVLKLAWDGEVLNVVQDDITTIEEAIVL